MSTERKQDSLKRSLRSEPFTAADRVFVNLLEADYAESNLHVLAAAALCLVSIREGHSYFDLSEPELPPSFSTTDSNDWPSLVSWKKIVQDSPSIGSHSDSTPLVFDGESALYLRKYFEYESQLANDIADKAMQSSSSRSNDSDSTDLQKHAVAQALLNRFYIISGGPGTGKTTTVLDYLIQAIQSKKSEKRCRIAAIAPTGKAAARLSESIRNGLTRFELDDTLKTQLLEIPCMTVHRLLQGLPNRISFRRNAKHPIEFDILVVDESSMIDLPLMQKLLDATPEGCSLVLIGDHHQLSSVEVGSVFGDLTRSANDPQSPLYGKSTALEKTYRFSEDSSIYQFCEACKRNDTPTLEALFNEKRDDFSFNAIENGSAKSLDPIIDRIVKAHQERSASPDLESAIQSIGQFATLTPFNRGVFGAQSINRIADARICRIHEVDPSSFYAGLPIIILENNYDLELFNGDIGIVWPDESSGELFAWFSDSANDLKPVRLNWLPKHAPAFCLTIHKSQGSEFEEVVGVFSPEDNDFISRQLVYTCASRAKQRLSIHGNQTALEAAIQRDVKRATLLEERILANKQT